MSVAPLVSIGLDDQNEVQHDFLDHVTPLAPALTSHDTDSIFSETITFLVSGQSK